MQELDTILNSFIKFEDININYLNDCNKRPKLDQLLATYNLKSTFHFPARISSGSVTVTDNIFINKSGNYTISSFINWLSDYDGQLIKLNNISIQKQKQISI